MFRISPFRDYLSLAFEWALSSTPPPLKPSTHPPTRTHRSNLLDAYCLPAWHSKWPSQNRWRLTLIILALNLSVGHRGIAGRHARMASIKHNDPGAEAPCQFAMLQGRHFYRVIKWTAEKI